MNDEILEEVRAIRHAHAAQFNFDLDAIFIDIQRCETEHALQGGHFIEPPSMPTISGYQKIRFGNPTQATNL
jgi:hypothetical protein